MSFVLDYVSERTDHAAMKAAGVIGVIRYLAPLPNPKVITKGKYQRLRAAGLDVALVWETTGTRTNEGRPAGTADGERAEAQAAALGYPADHIIYWAVDHQPVGDDLARAEEYGRAFCRACSYHCRPYGNDQVVDAMVAAGVADAGWQCRAWSGSPVRHSSHRVLFQRAEADALRLDGGYDTNDITRADWACTAHPSSAPMETETSMLVQHPDGHLEMFDVSAQKLMHNWQEQPKSTDWSGWHPLDATHQFEKLRGAVRGDDGNVNVVAKAADGEWAFWFDQDAQQWIGPTSVKA